MGKHKRYGIGPERVDLIKKSGGGHLDGLPHVPEWDCPGADAIREARLEAHRRIVADIQRLKEQREAAERMRAANRAETLSELQRLSEVLGSATKEGGAAARLADYEDLVIRSARLGVPRVEIIKALHVPNVALSDFLMERGFPSQNPLIRKSKN